MTRVLTAFAASAGAAATAQPVRVVVDMDSSRPGIQSTVDIQPGQAILPGVAVYIYDPLGTRSLMSIGYIGAIDRGIAFGHMRSNRNVGSVTALDPHPGTP